MPTQRKSTPRRRASLDQDYLEEIRAFWQTRTPRPLSREDAREIAHNLIGFFSVLREWSLAEAEQANAASPSDQSPQSDADPRPDRS